MATLRPRWCRCHRIRQPPPAPGGNFSLLLHLSFAVRICWGLIQPLPQPGTVLTKPNSSHCSPAPGAAVTDGCCGCRGAAAGSEQEGSTRLPGATRSQPSDGLSSSPVSQHPGEWGPSPVQGMWVGDWGSALGSVPSSSAMGDLPAQMESGHGWHCPGEGREQQDTLLGSSPGPIHPTQPEAASKHRAAPLGDAHPSEQGQLRARGEGRGHCWCIPPLVPAAPPAPGHTWLSGHGPAPVLGAGDGGCLGSTLGPR